MGASRSQSSWSRTCYCDDLSKVGLPQHGDAARTAQRISYSYLISFLLNLTHTTSASVQQLCLISSTPSLRAKGSVNAGDDFPFRFFIWPKLSEDNLSQNTVSYVFKARRAVGYLDPRCCETSLAASIFNLQPAASCSRSRLALPHVHLQMLMYQSTMFASAWPNPSANTVIRSPGLTWCRPKGVPVKIRCRLFSESP